MNKAAYTRYPDIIDRWHFDEGEDEMLMRNKKTIQKFTSRHNYFANIKTMSGKELHGFNHLKGYFHKHLISYASFKPEFTDYVNNDMDYLLKLMADIENY